MFFKKPKTKFIHFDEDYHIVVKILLTCINYKLTEG